MAAGSHLTNGIWALLVVAAKVSRKIINKEGELCIIIMLVWLVVRSKAMEIIIKASPMRFVSTVSIAAPRDLGFW